MTTAPVPRLVGATWYPVPAPEGVPLTLGFPSEEACASFCGAIGPVLEAFDDQLAVLEDKHCDALNDAEEAEYDRAWNEAEEACHEGACPGYNKGWSDALARSVESA